MLWPKRKLYSSSTAAKAEVERSEQELDQLVAHQLEKERKALSDDALRKAREQVTLELQDKDQQLTKAQAKLKDAQDDELALRKERRKLEDDKQAMELTLTRKLDDERAKIRLTHPGGRQSDNLPPSCFAYRSFCVNYESPNCS